MRTILLAAMLATPAVTLAAESYVVSITVLTTKGNVQRFTANNGARYSTFDECQLRMQAWERKNLAGFEAAMTKLRNEGKQAELSVKCERV